MQSNVAYERTQRPRNARPPVEFKAREEQRERRKENRSWERNDQRRRQSDMMN